MKRRVVLLLTSVFVVSACSDQAPVSGPGTLTGTVVGPNGDEGAAVVVLLGEVGGVTAVGGTEAYAQTRDGTTRVVLIHPDGGELAFAVSVPDTTQAPQAVVEEVAGPDDALRSDPGAYAVEFRR